MRDTKAVRTARYFANMASLGISYQDADALRRIEMTLSRWSKNECGNENGGAIERDETTGRPFWTYERGDGKRGRYAIPDRERGALKRAAAIMARYPHLWHYQQGDPRGCALYVGRYLDLPSGTNLSDPRPVLESYYTRGVAVGI